MATTSSRIHHDNISPHRCAITSLVCYAFPSSHRRHILNFNLALFILFGFIFSASGLPHFKQWTIWRTGQGRERRIKIMRAIILPRNCYVYCALWEMPLLLFSSRKNLFLCLLSPFTPWNDADKSCGAKVAARSCALMISCIGRILRGCRNFSRSSRFSIRHKNFVNVYENQWISMNSSL